MAEGAGRTEPVRCDIGVAGSAGLARPIVGNPRALARLRTSDTHSSPRSPLLAYDLPSTTS